MFSLKAEGFQTQEFLWAFDSVVFTKHFPNHDLSCFRSTILHSFAAWRPLKRRSACSGRPALEGPVQALRNRAGPTKATRAPSPACSRAGQRKQSQEREDGAERLEAPLSRPWAGEEQGRRGPAATRDGGGRAAGTAAAGGGRVCRGHRALQGMEGAPNAALPLGHGVCPGSCPGSRPGSCQRGRRKLPEGAERPLLAPCPAMGARRAPAPRQPLPSGEELDGPVVTVQ